MPTTIADYAIIGDCETAALVSRDGSIDWLCWPRFDSDACFAALLGTSEHGRWRIAPRTDKFRVSRRYRPNTLILETRFETDEGAVTLIDFMPLRSPASDIMRIVVGERGRVTMCMCWAETPAAQSPRLRPTSARRSTPARSRRLAASSPTW